MRERRQQFLVWLNCTVIPGLAVATLWNPLLRRLTEHVARLFSVATADWRNVVGN